MTPARSFDPLGTLLCSLGIFYFYDKVDPGGLEAMKRLGFTQELRLGTPAGEVARCDMYDRVINTFDECIAILKPTGGQAKRGIQSGAD